MYTSTVPFAYNNVSFKVRKSGLLVIVNRGSVKNLFSELIELKRAARRGHRMGYDTTNE